MIVNVTGGPDLSMMEVSEAASIIHTAAHEDANIIFGAVVDPDMKGRVKITVIATGFGDSAANSVASSAAQTPVDLQNYTDYQDQQLTVGTTVQVTRRPAISVSSTPVSDTDKNDRLGIDMSLETPAFLRRQSS